MIEFLHIEHTGASGTAQGPDMSLTQSCPQLGHLGTPRNDQKYLRNSLQERQPSSDATAFREDTEHQEMAHWIKPHRDQKEAQRGISMWV